MRAFIIIGMVICSAWTSEAQVIQSARVEFLIGRNDPNFEVLTAHQQGLFLHRRIAGQDDADLIEIIKLDTAFKENWRGFLPFDKHYKIIAKRSEKDKIFFLLRHQDFSKNGFILYAITQADGTFVRYDIKNYIPFVPTEFQVTDSAAIMGGYFNRVPVVTHYSFFSGRSKILPGLLNESGELTQVKTYHDGTFDVLIAAKNFQGQKTIWIKNYSANGDLLRNTALEPEGNKNLIFARSIKTQNNMQIVAGVFGSKNSEYSRGFFMASIDPSGSQQVRYYNFQDLENFFKYMKARRETRIKERIERRKIKGKKTRFNYRFLVHELVPYHDQFILLGEAFYPKYVSVDRGFYGGFFSPTPYAGQQFRDGRIFDGYVYTHAVVMGFDRDGQIVWDNSFEINDVKTFTLEQFVKLEIQSDKILLLYLFEDELRSKIIKGNQVLEGKSSEPIRGNMPNDLIGREERSENKLEYWYQKFFYASGVQEIINPQSGRRRVFYISKIACEK
jgi:hypothetical protein